MLTVPARVLFPLEAIASLILGLFGESGYMGSGLLFLQGLQALTTSSGPLPLAPPSPFPSLSFPTCSPGPEDIGPPIPEADELLNK